MKKLYCPKCGSYLEGGSGDLVDCHCGWQQPEDQVELLKEQVESEAQVASLYRDERDQLKECVAELEGQVLALREVLDSRPATTNRAG